MPIRFIALLLLGLALGALGHGQASARDLTAAERRSLAEAVDAYARALETQDVASVMEFSPPLVAAGKAERMGMVVPEMIAAMARQTAETGGAVVVHSIAIDLDAAEAGEAQGEPYLLIPTEIVVTFPGIPTGTGAGTSAVRERSHLLAFLEAEGWSLLRLGVAEDRALLTRLYPRFAAVPLPESTVERVRP